MSTALESPELSTATRVASTGLSRVFELLFVTACSLVVLVALAPDQLLTGTMPLGTDTVGHAVVAWWDSRNTLGFLPGSWSDDMFNGFPVNQLYPWLATWIAGTLSHIVPLGTAMKLVIVLPLVALPFSTWVAGSWARLPQPLPVMLAAGTLPFLFDTSCGSCGGSIASTVNGEFAFAWAMLFAVLALGAVDRLATTGKGGPMAALLVAATSVSHPLPTLWLMIGVGTIAIGREVWSLPSRTRNAFGVAAAAATLMASSWWIPFIAYRSWMPTNPLTRDGSFSSWLLPASTPWEICASLLALVGAAYAVKKRSILLIAFLVGALVAVAAFLRFTDGGPFYSIRVLPFWQFGRWMLAAVGFAWVVKMGVAWLRNASPKAVDLRVAPAAWFAIALTVVGSTWGFWGVTTPPTTTSPGEARILGQRVEVPAVSAGAASSFRGFEARSDSAELVSVQALLRSVGERYGCGTLMWDSGDPAGENGTVFGDAQVFWQAPIWTDGCVRSATGVLVDSSATAPAMLMAESLVSQAPEQLLSGRPAFALDLTQGVQRMKDLGIRYYLTQGGLPEQLAASQGKPLVKLATGGRWVVWGVAESSRLESLPALPAVFEPTLDNVDWESVNNRYFTTDTYSTVPLAQTGPRDWPTASLAGLPKPVEAPTTKLTSVSAESDSVTFSVERTGTPVMIRVSAFPGWQVAGADGPYRVSPNYLVVVPTSTTVTLTKSRTAIDWAAILAGLAGVALVVGAAVHQRLRVDADDAGGATASTTRPADDSGDDERRPGDAGDRPPTA